MLRRLTPMTFCLVLLTGMFMGFAGTAHGVQKVKDLRWAYMMHIVNYATWPTSTIDPVINVCVVGKSPFTSRGEDIVLNRKSGSIVVTKQYSDMPDMTVLRHCEVIYFSQSITLAQLSFVFSKLESLPIVTIGDHRAFLRIGGLFQFIPKGKKLRFKVNKSLLNKVALKFHPSLLRLSD